MNKKSLIPIFWTALIWLPQSCSREPGETIPPLRAAGLTVAEARDYFESGPELLTRSGEDAAGALTLGAFEPLWDAALPSEGWNLEAVDAPVEGDVVYRLSVGRDSLGRELGLRITHRLIILRQKATDDLCPYLIFYLPDSTYAAARPLQTAELCETLLSCDEKASFTGLALYTRTDGTPIAAQRYDEGMAGEAAFVFDTRYTTAENLERLCEVVGPVQVWKCEKTITRGVGDVNPIEPVPIYGQRPVIEIPIPPLDDKRVTEFNPTLPGFGGGPGGDGTDTCGYTKYPGNENLRTKDPEVLKLLDKLMEDCMGQVLIGALNRPIIIVTQDTDKNGFTVSTDPPQIHLLMKPESINIHDVILMEELFHAYQRQRLGNAVYDKRKLNCEIEAKLAWLMYRQREGNLTGVNTGLGGKFGRIFFELMADAIRYNAPLIFQNAYPEAAKFLKYSSVYRNYTYLENNYNIDRFNELIINCITEDQL